MSKKKSAASSTSEFTLPEEPTHAQLQAFFKSTVKRSYMTDEQVKMAQVCKEKLLNLADIGTICPNVEMFGNMLETEGLGEYLCLAPKRFHPDLVVEFYEKARMSRTGDSLTTTVMGVPLLITPVVIGDTFGLRCEGVSIGQFRDTNPKAMEAAWNAWKLPDAEPFKIAAKTTQMQGYYKFLADFVTKCISCDVGSMSEMNRRRWSVMMAMEAGVEGNWAEFVFERILDYSRANVSIEGTRKVPATGVFHQKVNFGLKISYLIEKLVPGVGKEAGERLTSSDWLPPNPSADRESPLELPGEEGYQQTLLRLPILTALSEPRAAAPGGGTSTSTSRRPSLRKPVPEKKKKSTAPGLKRKAPEEPRVPRKKRTATPPEVREVITSLGLTSSEEEEEVPQLILRRKRNRPQEEDPQEEATEITPPQSKIQKTVDAGSVSKDKGKKVVSETTGAEEEAEEVPETHHQTGSSGPIPAQPVSSFTSNPEQAFIRGVIESDEDEEVQEVVPGLHFFQQQVARHTAKLARIAFARELLDKASQETLVLLKAAKTKVKEIEEQAILEEELLLEFLDDLATQIEVQEEMDEAARTWWNKEIEDAKAAAEVLRLVEEIREAQEAVELAEALGEEEEAEAAAEETREVAEEEAAEIVSEDIPESSSAPSEEQPSGEVITTIVPFSPIVLRPEPSSQTSSVAADLQQFMIQVAQTVETNVSKVMQTLEETRKQTEELMRRDKERQEKEAFYDSSLATLFDIVKKGEEERRRDKEERLLKEKEIAEERLRQEKERLAREAEEESKRHAQFEEMLRRIQERIPSSSASPSIPPPP